jgi:hypothetical protein
MGKVVLVMVMVAVLPTQPVFGVKLTLGQPPGPQPAAATIEAGIVIAVSSDSKAAPSNNFILRILRLYDFLANLSNLSFSHTSFFPSGGGERMWKIGDD